jgi:hypothetical protein
MDVDEHRGRPVDDVAGGELTPPRLQQVLKAAALALRDLLVDGKDRAHRHVDRDVSGAVERVVQQDVVPARKLIGDRYRIVDLFRRHHTEVAGVVHRVEHDVVGELV